MYSNSLIPSLETRNDEGGVSWLKVVYHNSTNEVFFDKEKNEQLFIITREKYSILKYLDKIYRYNLNEYEFLLEYPNEEDIEDEFNWWKQTKNPTESRHETDIGYEPINISWPGAYFGGLYLNENDRGTSASFLKGSNSSKFAHYAICAYHNYTYWNTFAGPKFESSTNPDKYNQTFAKEVKLWIRIADTMHPFLKICTQDPYLLRLQYSLSYIFTSIFIS